MSTAIGVSLPRLATAVGKAVSEYAVLGKTPGFTADFIKNKYPSYSSFASAITHSRSGNAVMTDGYGPELVVNGGFDSDSDWTKGGAWAITNGVAFLPSGTSSILSQSLSTTADKMYEVTFNVSAISTGWFLGVRLGSGSNQTSFTTEGPKTVYLQDEGDGILRFASGVSGSFTIDNVSVREMPVLKWAPHNLLTYSEDFTHSSYATNAVTLTPNYGVAPDGTNTATRVVRTGTAAYVIRSGMQNGWTKGVWIRSTSGSGTVGVGSYYTTPDATYNITEEWQLIEREVDTTETAGFNLYCVDFRAGTIEDVMIWGAHVYRSDLGGMADNPDQPPSRASYVPTTSTERYLPRIGHHVFNGNAWVNEGLLAESEARTNILPKSGEFSTWAQNNATTTDNAEISPDGMTSASTIITNTVNGEHFVQYNLSSATGTFTDSVYVKADGYKLVFIRPVHVGATEGNTQSIRFDIEAGTVLAAPSGTTGTIQDVGNGWYRIAATFTISGTITGAYGFRLQILSDSGGSSFAGDGTSGIQVYGAQREEASTPSSLIPTSGSSVTRAAETFTIPSANLPWPSPQYIGSERLTGSWAVPTGYDNTTSSTGTSVSTTGGSTQSRVFLPIDGVDAGEVYQVTLTVNSTSTGNVDFYFRDGPTGGSGTLLLNQLAIPSGGSFTGHVAAASGDMVVLLIGASGADYDVSISVREINPLSVSIAMDGRISHRGVVDTFFRWLEDGNNYINNVYWTDYRFIAAQKDGTTYDQVASDVNLFSGDLLEPYNFASRHGSTFLNGAVDGVAFTANTTPTALPDLSATDLNLASDYMGTIGTFRIWDKDITDAGLVEATNPSLEPSLSLTFEGVGTNSFVVNDWSE